MRKPAVVLITIAFFLGSIQTTPYSTSAQAGDRCGHVAKQRIKMRRRLRAIGATRVEIRKVMRKCKRRKGIPYIHGSPGQHLTTASERTMGLRCDSRTVTAYSWAAPTPMDQINPYTYRLMDLKWRISYCFKKRRKVIRNVHWDVSGDPTQLGSVLGWSFEGVIDRAGWYSSPTPNRPCRVNGKKRPKACYETWVRSRIDICILNQGCVGQKLPYVRAYLYCACSQGFGVLVTTIRDDPG
jgi:hypothetical protein